VASDLYNEAPLWYLRLKQAAERGATLITVNPRQTKLEHYAQFTVRYSYGQEVETLRGLTALKKNKIGELISTAENLLVFYGSDGLGLEGSVAVAAACAELVKDRPGKANNGLIGIWPRANDQGAWELGFRPAENLSALLKDKVVYIVAADPAGDDPELKAALRAARFVAVQELYLTETANLAEVVLPAQAYTEREGSFTSGERRVQRFYPALTPHGETRADFAISAAIAKELGLELEGRSAARVMDRLAASIKTFAGISYRMLSEGTAQWPIAGRGDLYYGGTTYENKQGLGVQLALNAPGTIPASSAKFLHPDEDQPLAVPVTRLYDRGITVTSSELLHAHVGEASAFIHPATAMKFNLAAGGQVKINGFLARVQLDETVPASVVLLPRSMGFPINAPVPAGLKKA
jgi:NADH-quinone oxidoreductase subunit G